MKPWIWEHAAQWKGTDDGSEVVRCRSCCEDSGTREQFECMLDTSIGEQLIEGTRLDKVMQVRAKLLAGADKELVLAFPSLHDAS